MRTRVILATLALSCALPTANAQIIRAHEGEFDYQRLGHSLAFVGDCSGDGIEDYAIGSSPGCCDGFGRLELFSGADGVLLWKRLGTHQHYLGEGLSRVGDVNGDGADDVLVGINFEVYSSACDCWYARGVVVLSGVDGSVLQEYRDFAWDVGFGISVAGMGDVNGDGVPDYVGVGEEAQDSIVAFSGLDGQPFWSLNEPSRSVAALGDLDGDGVQEIAVGHPRWTSKSGKEVGRVQVLDGATGAVLFDHPNLGGIDGHEYGFHVVAAGDVDGDGVPDYAIGAPDQGGHTAHVTAFVDVRSGATGKRIRVIEGQGGRGLGGAMASVGDLDQDGRDELMIGDPGTYSSLVQPGIVFFTRIYSIATGAPVWTSVEGQGFGWAIDSADMDGDGTQEVIHAHRGKNGAAGSHVGRVQLRRPEIMTDVVTTYCETLPNTTGLASYIELVGSTSVSTNDLVLRATNTPPKQFGIFYYGPLNRSVEFHGYLCIWGPYYRLPALPTGGTVQYKVDLLDPPPSHPLIQGGDTWYFQFWYRDPPNLYNLSNGLEVTFRP